MTAIGARYSALTSWTREILGIGNARGERVVAQMLRIYPGLIAGKGKPHNMIDLARAANENLIEQELLAEHVRQQVG